MNRALKSTSLKRYGAVLATAALIALVLAPNALAVHDNGIFELDGDAFEDGAVLGEDWSQLDDWSANNNEPQW
ncbi:MAG TPA: hypothetical protein VFC71_09440 [Candidatus Polarisedimenticolia bacterium]|nr:hypothetical protein [Candidatus Polarisedimenticolia bacterium]